MRHLTARQARLLHLGAQGLLAPPRKPATRQDVREAVARMALLQIDTIQVVARSPYLVLFSRLGPYDPAWLDELVAGTALFEVWAHEACIAPIEDYPLHRRSLETRRHWFVDRVRRLLATEGPGMRRLLARVRRRGPVKAADFAGGGRPGSGWWSWKKEKSWLEAWLALGELMVARRERFQRVYDLRERVYPGAGRLALPAPEEARLALAERAVRALGVAPAAWVHDYFRTRPRLDDADLEPLVAAGRVERVAVRGWEAPGYLHADHRALARRIAAGRVRPTRTALLSPFDPVVWDRERARALFGFEYRLECYTPAPRRRHGYFALPLLWRGELVGRLDAKAHRAEGCFEIRSLHLEPGVRPGPALLADLAETLRACAAWHGTPRVEVVGAAPPALRRRLQLLLARRA